MGYRHLEGRFSAMTIKIERRAPYQGVPQWGITGCAEITPSKATAQKWAALETAALNAAAKRRAQV
jgi:hypothetical protein